MTSDFLNIMHYYKVVTIPFLNLLNLILDFNNWGMSDMLWNRIESNQSNNIRLLLVGKS